MRIRWRNVPRGSCIIEADARAGQAASEAHDHRARAGTNPLTRQGGFAGEQSMTLETTITWCWDGGNVVYVDVPGGSTTRGPGGYHYDPFWSYWEWDQFTRWSYGYLNTPNYDIYKTARWRCIAGNCAGRHYGCVHNVIHLNGNGTYSTNPSAVEDC